MLSEKFAITQLRAEESVGLLSLRETERSFFVKVDDRQVLNHMLNICSTNRLKYVSNN